MEKLLKYIDKTKTCWIWTGRLNHNGYSKIHYNGKHTNAHRVVYELLVGKIPEGLEIDHLCRNRACVNPKHLEPVTHIENIARATKHLKRKQFCKNGHPFSPENTAPRNHKGKDWRICKLCRHESVRRFRAKRKAEEKNYQCIT